MEQTLRTLEESLWIAKTRFDQNYMDQVLAPSFFEFGRSGNVYNREQILNLNTSDSEIHAKIPLKNFQIHQISDDVVLITYISEVQYETLEIANRSSLWLKTPNTPHGWQLQFHQGTPVN